MIPKARSLPLPTRISEGYVDLSCTYDVAGRKLSETQGIGAPYDLVHVRSAR
jgi:hypothetical protein